MNDIKIGVIPENNDYSASEDIDRIEGKWNDRSELLLTKWIKHCKLSSELHQKKGKKFKCLYTVFGLPSMIIPLTIGILEPYLKHYDLVISLLMILSAICSGVATFFDFSKKKMNHLHYDSLYADLALNIEKIMATSKAHRQPVDVTMVEIMMKLSEINKNAPLL